jgi:hypothetical protein
LLAILGSRQYDQWQSLRHLDPTSTEVALRVEKLCENICKALQQPWVSPQERQEAEARQQAEEERHRREMLEEEAQRRADEERRRQEAETRRCLDKADAEKRRQDREQRKLELKIAGSSTKRRASMSDPENASVHFARPCPICDGIMELSAIDSEPWSLRTMGERLQFRCTNCGVTQSEWTAISIEAPSTAPDCAAKNERLIQSSQ